MSEEATFNIKHKFTLNGYTMYDVLITQEKFQYNDYFKRKVCFIDGKDLNEKWKHPLIIDMKEKIEQYGMKIKCVFINLYENGNDYHDNLYGDENVFNIFIGGSRILLAKNKETNETKKYLLNDGDLYFFNSEFNKRHIHSIPKVKNLETSMISVIFFI